MTYSSGSDPHVRRLSSVSFFDLIGVSGVKFSTSILATGITAFLFFLSLASFVENVGGYLITPTSPYFALEPSSILIYQAGASPGMALFIGMVISFVNFYFQYTAEKRQLICSMAISAFSAAILIVEVVMSSPYAGGSISYLIIPAFLSLLPSTQLSMASPRTGDSAVGGEGESHAAEQRAIAPESDEVGDAAVAVRKLRTDESTFKAALSKAATEERFRTLEHQIQSFGAILGQIEQRQAMAVKPVRVLKPPVKVVPAAARFLEQPGKRDSSLVTCTACGSRTPVNHPTCIYCGINRNRYARRSD